MPAKKNLASVLHETMARGWQPALEESVYAAAAACGLRSINWPLAFAALDAAEKDKPLTLRGLLYRLVSAGWLPSTDRTHYARLGRVATVLRERGIMPFGWIVDNVRSTQKPSSWAGLTEYGDVVRRTYRKDFWAQMPEYVHVIVEKDAIAGVLAPVTRLLDVALSPLRGYVSLSFAHGELAATWNRITKPIHVYYLGDYDPSGFDLERDCRAKLTRYCTRPFSWTRLAVNQADFAAFGLIPLQPKTTDRRYAQFLREHGEVCAELDALPATELRARVEQAILAHVDREQWERLQHIELLEKQQFAEYMRNWTGLVA